MMDAVLGCICSYEIADINELRKLAGLPPYGETKRIVSFQRYKTLKEAQQMEEKNGIQTRQVRCQNSA